MIGRAELYPAGLVDVAAARGTAEARPNRRRVLIQLPAMTAMSALSTFPPIPSRVLCAPAG
jgi:hypothetical protein